MSILTLTIAAVALAVGLALWRDLRRRVRTVTVTITADATQFEAEMRKAAESVRRMRETIRERLLPGFQATAAAFVRLASSYDDADARWVAEHRSRGWQPNQREDA